MRLSSLVVAAILLVSVTLLAQHASGGGGGGGGSSSGGSHGGSSGGSGFSASSTGSHSFSGSASHVASAGSPSSRPSSTSSSSKVSSAKQNASLAKKSSRSLLHPFRKPKPVQSAAFKRPAPCVKGFCTPCSSGESRNGKGACVITSNACSSGQAWNGFACGVPYWSNDCEALAGQMADQRRQMEGQSDYGQALRLRRLQDQYDQCLRRFGSYPFFSAFLFDTP